MLEFNILKLTSSKYLLPVLKLKTTSHEATEKHFHGKQTCRIHINAMNTKKQDIVISVVFSPKGTLLFIRYCPNSLKTSIPKR